MPSAERLQSHDFQWTALAAIVVVLVAAIPAAKPNWFVEPTGQITMLGGLGPASLLALGLLLGWQWVRYLTLAFLTVIALSTASWAFTNANPPFQAGFLLLAATATLAGALLAFPRPVRSYFRRGEPEEQPA
ncbi:MAG: hypothetical protein GVY12_00365 [Bacteroidetes bacterium]|nr:hypothetical protein [Bacteroidota bacterium]